MLVPTICLTKHTQNRKKVAIVKLFNDFESLVNHTEDGIEFWFARDLQHLLGYMEWRNFQKITAKAKIVCQFPI